MKNLLVGLLIGLIFTLGITSAFGNGDKFKVDITEAEYQRDWNGFVLEFDPDVDNLSHLSHARNYSSFYATDMEITILWNQDPQTGAPPPEAGFVRKNNSRPRPNSSGAYVDKRGNSWKKDKSQHGGEHWDVSFSAGGHINVMPPIPENPKWSIRGGEKAFKNLPSAAKSKARAILRRLNENHNEDAEITYSYDRRLSPIMGRAGDGCLVHENSKTTIGISILPTEGSPYRGVLLLIPEED